MNWSEETMDALDHWLSPDTCWPPHPNDDKNFFVFIGHVWKDTHTLWDESYIREIIRQRIKKLHSTWTQELIEKLVERARSDGTIILDFLCGLNSTNNLNKLLPIQY